MARDVAFHPLAEADLFDLYAYIEASSGSDIAKSYIDRIEAVCANLCDMPERGAARDDLAPGIRTLSIERRVLVAYRLSLEVVVILRVLYGGRYVGAADLPD